MAVEANLGETAVELRAPGGTVPAGELVHDQGADVVTGALVLAPGIAEADDEQIERRGAFAPAPGQTHGRLPLGGAGLALVRLAAALGGALRALLARDTLELALFALGECLFGLLDTGRHRQ